MIGSYHRKDTLMGSYHRDFPIFPTGSSTPCVFLFLFSAGPTPRRSACGATCAARQKCWRAGCPGRPARRRVNEEKEGTPEIHGRFMVELWDNCGISWEIIGL